MLLFPYCHIDEVLRDPGVTLEKLELVVATLHTCFRTIGTETERT